MNRESLMSPKKHGDQSINFCLPDEVEKEICLSHFHGKWIVLYFYPKDNTSGCTLEAVHFTQKAKAFKEKKCVILGVSPDSPKSHCNFRKKHDLEIILLSDTNHEIIESYGAWVRKKMYGREYFGVERSTFLIDPNGQIVHVWRKVKVPNHVDTVMSKLIECQEK